MAHPKCPDGLPLGSGDSASFSAARAYSDSIQPQSSPAIADGSRLQAALLHSTDYPGGLVQAPKKLWIFDRKTLALGGTLAFSIPIVMLEYQWWWRDDYRNKPHKFRYEDEGWFEDYSMGVDKCGHFFTSYLYFHTFYDLMKWAGYSENTSLWTALAVPAAHAISVELCDGFSRYSFSGTDLTANFLGMGYAYAQIKVPYLRNFNFKWSYYESSANALLGDDHGFAADYTGHTYWMSVNMKNVLPEAAAQYWPKYLNLAMGYGASSISWGEPRSLAKHKFAFALDYNLGALPIMDDTWAMLVHLADKLHYPAPGIKTYTGGRTQAKPFLLY
jgi:hypothetical protein